MLDGTIRYIHLICLLVLHSLGQAAWIPDSYPILLRSEQDKSSKILPFLADFPAIVRRGMLGAATIHGILINRTSAVPSIPRPVGSVALESKGNSRAHATGYYRTSLGGGEGPGLSNSPRIM